jgi:hypothetical protein
MEGLLSIVPRIDLEASRYRSALNVLGWVCFGIITADYARFINLPALVIIPLWLGVLINIFRWAIWEGMVKPHVRRLAEHEETLESSLPDPPKS